MGWRQYTGLSWTLLMKKEQHRSSKERLEPSLTREAAIVMWLTEEVLEHKVNLTPVGGTLAGGGQQLDKWICVRKKKKGEKRERETDRERERERERETQRERTARGWAFFILNPLWPITPCNQGGLPLAESSGPGYRHPPRPQQSPNLETQLKV